jgi:hypothetical protein
MLPDGTPKDDVKVPEGQIGTDIEAAFEGGKEVSVTIIAAMGTLPDPDRFSLDECVPLTCSLFPLRS